MPPPNVTPAPTAASAASDPPPSDEAAEAASSPSSAEADDTPDWLVDDAPPASADAGPANEVIGAGAPQGAWDGSGDAPLDPPTYDLPDFDAGPPPTEEVPGGVMEDVGVAYNAPMNVPEPPPLPGILDRFTPPPVQQRSQGGGDAPSYLDDMGYSAPSDSGPGGGYDSDRPSYLATPEPAERDLAPVSKKVSVEEDFFSEGDEDVVPVRAGVPMAVIAGGAAVMFVAILGIGGVAMMLTMGGGGGEPAPVPLPADGGVEVRGDMRQEPGLIGQPVDDEADNDDEVDDAPSEPEPEPEPVPEPEPEPEPAPAPAPTAAPAPAAPRPAPRPSPKPAPAAAPAARGTLKIRSNRRVLIYVDNRAVGYAPQDLPAAPGEHTVSAMIAGRPASKRTETVKVEGGGTASVDFTF